MEYIDVKQFKGKVRQDARKVTFKNVHGKTNTVVFSYQKTKFGFKRFFCCPYCQKRVQKLYYVDHNYKCRECSGINPYRGIKNMTKGGADEIAYRMILSILVDTFISKISLTMQPGPKIDSISGA